MSDRLNEALKLLGHIYCPLPEKTEHIQRVRHIVKVFVPTGEIRPICGTSQGEEIAILGCPALWLDSNCEECREIEGNNFPAITKRSLMLNLVNQMCNIEQMFLDAMYWNYHNRHEVSLNPDTDGEMSRLWLDFYTQLLSMAERFKPTIEKHEKRFGWADDLEEKL